jgi:hypothetical protein
MLSVRSAVCFGNFGCAGVDAGGAMGPAAVRVDPEQL